MALISNLKTPDDQTFDIRAGAIPYGQVDSTSTATVFTATVPGINELVDGTTVMLKNGVVTSTTNFTINVNGLGAKPVYNNMAAATRDTTIFNVNYTMLFVYDEDRVSGGAWICYRGYDANTNTIGYQLRTNSTVMNVSDTARYYKMYFMSADNTLWVPASVNSTNNATAARPVNQRPINPFGRIVYTSASTNYAAGVNLAATTIWDQYVFNLGYSFNRTGAALTMTVEKPVYLKCAPQTDGSAIMDADDPIVQALPTTADGKIYIYLGVAYSATNIELVVNHPVYYHDGTGIRQWTGAASSGGAVDSVNGQTGTVVLDAEDVGALATSTVMGRYEGNAQWLTDDAILKFRLDSEQDLSSASISIAPPSMIKISTSLPTDSASLDFDGSYISYSKNGAIVSFPTPPTNSDTLALVSDIPTVPTKTSDLTNDSGFITSSQAPVQSVNGQTGAVSITIPTVPSAATASPLMDGTAAVGSSSKWAKEDHVHPTDTSRQATLVSGTNIKTINGNSLLGSGDLTVGGSAPTTTTATLTVAGWSSNTQTVSVTGVTASNTVIVSAAPSSISDYTSAGVYCSAQGSGTLTFTCSTAPTSALTVNVMIFD